MTKVISSLLGMWMACGTICVAQISTFPAPPPLPPQTRNEPQQSSIPSSSFPSSGTTTPQPSANSTGLSPDPAGSPATPAGPASPSPITAATLSSMTALDDKATLQPGDRISFRVIEDRDSAIPLLVTDTGEVEFPYVGRLRVQGQTCRAVALQLKRLLEVDYYKSATVIVGLDIIAAHEVAPKEMAWVVGQIRQPGPQEIAKNQPFTVSQIIMRAGGFGDFADQRRVRLIHRGASSGEALAENPDSDQDGKMIDVKAIFDGRSTVDPVVRPNDYIIVPKRLFNY